MNDKLIKTMDPLIKKIASNFYGIDYDELIQVGRIGLYNAYKQFPIVSSQVVLNLVNGIYFISIFIILNISSFV